MRNIFKFSLILSLSSGSAYSQEVDYTFVPQNATSGQAIYTNYTDIDLYYMASIDSTSIKTGWLKKGDSMTLDRAEESRLASFMSFDSSGANFIDKTFFSVGAYNYVVRCDNNDVNALVEVRELDSDGHLIKLGYCIPKSVGGTGQLEIELYSESMLHVIAK
ncbi:hypothetical protein [Vibrio navarrensis]|uniref:hypothetical protein n=1 Tax=Vibrio navarrensis TaxID=29495 RepID=UPI001559898C|nr:hypothetical protein [Vibrio navarrensis]